MTPSAPVVFARHLPTPLQRCTSAENAELTGEIADGAVLNYCVPPDYNDNALELLQKGLDKSGRKMEDFDRPQLIVCSVDQDHDKAIDN